MKDGNICSTREGLVILQREDGPAVLCPQTALRETTAESEPTTSTVSTTHRLYDVEYLCDMTYIPAARPTAGPVMERHLHRRKVPMAPAKVIH